MVAVHRADDAEIVSTLGDVWEQRADFQAGLTVPVERPIAGV